jgi:antitoxin HicB
MIRGYQVDVCRLSDALGGGFAAWAPALRGCMSDGASEEEALRNLEDAIECWLAAARVKGRKISAAKPAHPVAMISVP